MASPQAVRVSFALALSDVTVELDRGQVATLPISDQPPGQHHIDCALTAPPGNAESPLVTAFCLLFKLSPAESRALMKLMEHKHVSREALHFAISRDGNPVSKIKTVDVIVCRLRGKLATHDIEIVTVRGLGFRLAEGARDKIQGTLNQYITRVTIPLARPDRPRAKPKNTESDPKPNACAS